MKEDQSEDRTKDSAKMEIHPCPRCNGTGLQVFGVGVNEDCYFCSGSGIDPTAPFRLVSHYSQYQANIMAEKLGLK